MYVSESWSPALIQAHMRIFAAYGSTKDISVYTSIGLPPFHIYIVGRPTKKMQHQCQVRIKCCQQRHIKICQSETSLTQNICHSTWTIWEVFKIPNKYATSILQSHFISKEFLKEASWARFFFSLSNVSYQMKNRRLFYIKKLIATFSWNANELNVVSFLMLMALSNQIWLIISSSSSRMATPPTCPSSSTARGPVLPSPPAPAWSSAKAASAWERPVVNSSASATTSFAPSPPSSPAGGRGRPPPTSRVGLSVRWASARWSGSGASPRQPRGVWA